MDCLRSFLIEINQNRTFTSTVTDVKTWGSGSDKYWVVQKQGSSIFNIKGFKNIDLYGVEMIGDVQTTLGINDGGIVENFAFGVAVGGQQAIIGGEVQAAPNDFAINQLVNSFYLNKYEKKIMFESPFSGCSSVNFASFKAQGYGAETLNSINLDIALVFKFYYKFEGE